MDICCRSFLTYGHDKGWTGPGRLCVIFSRGNCFALVPVLSGVEEDICKLGRIEGEFERDVRPIGRGGGRSVKSFALTQTAPLDDYIQDFSRLSLNVTALDEHSSALLFVRGLTDGLRADVMREHPRTLSEAIRAARTASRNAVLTRHRG